MQDRDPQEFLVIPARRSENQIMKKYPMIKKIGIVALFALIIIPAGVMAAGFHGSSAGKCALSADGQEFQQQRAENSLVLGEQYRSSSQAGFEENADKNNGQEFRNRNCTKDCDLMEDQFGNKTRTQAHSMQHDQCGDQLQNMTGTHARLKGGSCGNCPAR
jgi:hypothetical protein